MFKTAIDAGVDSIMVGHISCPSLQNDAVDGIYPPATLSYDLMTKVLKEEMGFSGVVVSDALIWADFCAGYTSRTMPRLSALKQAAICFCGRS